MTAGLKRYYGANHLHFVTCSCHRREPWLGSAGRRDLFLKIIERVRMKYAFVVLGYVVMPEHFHLLMSEPQGRDPSLAIQALKLGFARHILAVIRDHHASRLIADSSVLHGWGEDEPFPHHVWEPRFYDFNVWSEDKRVEKLRYIHRNPVMRGLVPQPDQWPWSSFRAYVYGEQGLVRVNGWEVLKMKVRTG